MGWAAAAGRAYAAYGGVYVVAALLWAVLAEGEQIGVGEGLVVEEGEEPFRGGD